MGALSAACRAFRETELRKTFRVRSKVSYFAKANSANAGFGYPRGGILRSNLNCVQPFPLTGDHLGPGPCRAHLGASLRERFNKKSRLRFLVHKEPATAHGSTQALSKSHIRRASFSVHPVRSKKDEAQPRRCPSAASRPGKPALDFHLGSGGSGTASQICLPFPIVVRSLDFPHRISPNGHC